MEQDRKKDSIENYFGTLPTVHIHAKYEGGKFHDIETGKEVVLSDKSIVKMTTLLANIKDEDYRKFAEEQRKKVLPAGSILFIRMPVFGQGEYRFIIELREDLYMKKVRNKESVVEPCLCEVVDREETSFFKDSIKFEPFTADSLNQAFFQASVRYRPKNKSHATNIYRSCFLEDGRSISSLRF